MARKKITAPEDSAVKDAIANGDSAGFKQTLLDTLQESNSARAEMKSVLHELLRQPDTEAEIREIVNKVDRDSVKAFWGKFGFAVWSAIIFITGAAATVLIQNTLK